ncbi:unnamed protein product [Ectocarpus fasciculatus]
MSRLPRDQEERRAGTSPRRPPPRRSSTGSMLQKLFNSSSGPYQPHKVKEEVAAAAAAGVTASLVSVSLASSEDARSTDDGGSGLAAEGATQAAAAAAIPPPQTIPPETPLHMAPRFASSPPRGSTAVAAAGEAMETVALDLPQFSGAGITPTPKEEAAAALAAMPRVVSAEEGDVDGDRTSAAYATTTTANSVISLDKPAERSAGAVTRCRSERGGGGTDRSGGDFSGVEEAMTAVPAAPAPTKKRRAKSLPPAPLRRPRLESRPCLAGPSSVIQNLTLNDGGGGGKDDDAWALSEWLHGAASATAAASGGGGGGDDPPPPAPTLLPQRRATTLVG